MGEEMVAARTPALDLAPVQPTHKWFGRSAVVVTRGDRRDVVVGGTLIGSFSDDERTERDLVLVALCHDPKVRYDALAKAFGISVEGLRLIRAAYDAGGPQAILDRRPRGRQPKVTSGLRERAQELFAQGLTIEGVRKRLKALSRSTVGRLHREWKLSCTAPEVQAELQTSDEPAPAPAPSSAEACPESDPERGTSVVETTVAETTVAETSAAPAGDEQTGEVDEHEGAGDEEQKDAAPERPTRKIRSVAPSTQKDVQHVGTWLAMGVLASMGMYEIAKDSASKLGVGQDSLRIALDALIASLCIAEGSVEGARRLSTPTASELLRTTQAPSPPWMRGKLGSASAKGGGMAFHLAVAERLVAQAHAAEDRPAVFYIDNHVRPYSGRKTIRKAWRMQDRRARPGITDAYVHDDDGRPIMKWQIPDHAPLTDVLPRLANVLQFMLGEGAPMLLAFDRGGSYAETLSTLREKGVQFVTYEKKPYAQLATTKFTDTFLDDDEEEIGVCEAPRRNLGNGRGRVRRIALRMPDGAQVNLLTNSDLGAKDLYLVMRGRWQQENAFKHGKERWGINQLDGRQTTPYPDDAIIPNPARGRLDRALRIARTREGDLRCKLAQETDTSRRVGLEDELRDAVRAREELEAQRPELPAHAPVKDTDLAGKLVRHNYEYKLYIDTVRIALANAESELATILAGRLARPREAKMVLANLFKAPGSIRVGKKKITVSLKPAANANELAALRLLLDTCTGWSLPLPGDSQSGRTLAFRLQE